MNSEFEIISQSRAPSAIILADYNKSTNEFISVGPGYFVVSIYLDAYNHFAAFVKLYLCNRKLQVNEYTLREKNSEIFIFAFLLNGANSFL